MNPTKEELKKELGKKIFTTQENIDFWKRYKTPHAKAEVKTLKKEKKDLKQQLKALDKKKKNK